MGAEHRFHHHHFFHRGIKGYGGSPIYTASKHALVGLTQNMAYQYSSTGVHINRIAPGQFTTEVLDRCGDAGFGADKTFSDKLSSTFVTLPGAGNLEDIAHLAVYLASDESHFVNGAAISCDGGWAPYYCIHELIG